MHRPTDNSVGQATRGDAAERLFVIGVYAVMSAALYFYVWNFGRNVPFWDDWELVPVMTGHEPLTLSWLWSPSNEHTIPLARLAIVLTWWLTGDLRTVMFISATMLCLGVWGLVETTRRLRGRSAFTDAVYPLALLNWGLFENLIFSIQFYYVAAGVLGLAVVTLGMGRTTLGPGRTTAIAACLAGLPLCGAIGVAMLPCLLIWAAATGIRAIRPDDLNSRRCGAVLLAGCVLAVIAALGSIAVFAQAPAHANRGTLFETARASCEMLSMSIGRAGLTFWRLSSIGTMAAVAGSAAFVLRSAWKGASEFVTTSLLCAGIGAYLCVVAAVGFGRGGFGPGQGFSNRYALFTSILLCLCHLGFSLYARGLAGRAIRIGIFFVLTAALTTNVTAGIEYGIDRAERADSFVAAINSGAPSGVVAAQFAGRIYPSPELLAERLEMLLVTRSGPYARPAATRGQARCRAVDVSLTGFDVEQLELDDELHCVTRGDPFVVFGTPERVYHCGARLRFKESNTSAVAPEIKLHLGDAQNASTTGGRRYASAPIDRSPVVPERIVRKCESVGRLSFDLPGPSSTFELKEVSPFVRETPR